LAKKQLKDRWKKIGGKMADTIVSRELAERGQKVGREMSERGQIAGRESAERGQIVGR
jgi:hypothetical protein